MNPPDSGTVPRLTSLAHGGGCGCKLAPAALKELLHGQFAASGFANLLVGNGGSDDAAVWQMDGGRCIVATTDFFMPVVDDPADFGRIAATNAISDIYAMGARPLFALAILGVPINILPTATVRAILAGGAEICAQANIPVAGGHSIDSAEPIYGLAVIGECGRDELKTNAGAKVGDCLILTKPLGVGVYSAALKQGVLDDAGYAELIASTTALNAVGELLGREAAVHAMTDVTGFGLVGHALEMARASGVGVEFKWGALPWLTRAADLAQAGIITGASGRNWQSVSANVQMAKGMAEWQRALLTDPQTSGGLLVAAEPDAAPRLLAMIQQAGFAEAAIIGTAVAGVPQITMLG